MATYEYDKIITLPVLATFKDECDDLYAFKTELTVKGVEVNGSALTPDANGIVDIIIVESTSLWFFPAQTRFSAMRSRTEAAGSF